MQDGGFSHSASRSNLPIREIHGSADPFCDPGKPFFAQWQAAKTAAKAHGFANISEEAIPGKGHMWLADEALGYFESVRHR
jgi:hypothetical protein